MHVALMLDADRMREELPLLNRLVVGLMAEGIRVTRLVPEGPVDEFHEQDEARIALTRRVEIPGQSIPWLTRWRAERIAEQLERDPPDCLLLSATDHLPLAARLAERLEIPLAMEVWEARQAMHPPSRRRLAHVSAFIARGERLAETLRGRVDPGLVACVPLGVAIPAEPAQPLPDDGRTLAVAAVGLGEDVPAYAAMLAGLARFLRESDLAINVFLELRDRHDREIWREVRRHDLLGAVSTFQHAAAHRTLLTACDLLLVPERSGVLRSILLEVMVRGVPVIAGLDPFQEALIAGETALLIDAPEPDGWHAALRRVTGDRAAARALGARGRDHVQAHHGSTQQIEQLAEVLRLLRSGGTWRLDEQ